MSITEAAALLRDAAALHGELRQMALAIGVAALLGVAASACQELQIARAGGEPLGWFGVGAIGLLALGGAVLITIVVAA